MNKSDKDKIIKAINFLMEDECKFQNAIVLLGSMVGIRFPGQEAVLSRKPEDKVINVLEILRKIKNSEY